MLGLVGNNGAGKTTLFRLILDLLQADRGNVTINDIDVSESEDWKNFTGAFIDDGFLIDLPHSRRILLFHRQDVRSEEEEVDERLLPLRTLHERRSDGAEKNSSATILPETSRKSASSPLCYITRNC